MIQGFKDFIMRGNVVELAVGVVIGASFNAVVKALVDAILNPLIAALFGQPDFSEVGKFTINNAEFAPGVLLTAIVQFLLTAAAIYFFVVVPMNKMNELREKKLAAAALEDESAAEEMPELTAQEKLLIEIRDLLAQK